MEVEKEIREKLEDAIGRDESYIRYILSFDNDRGSLDVDGTIFHTRPYSFGEVGNLVRKIFDERYKIERTSPVGFRGETYVADGKTLTVYATGSAGLLEFYLRSGESKTRTE